MAQLQRHGGAQPDNSQGLPYADYQHLVRNGFEISDGNSIDEAPPAYGEFHDHMQFNQPGYSAGAAVTDDGRVNINISSSTNRLADLLAPTFNRQIAAQHEPDLPPAYIPPSLGGRPDQVPPPRLNVVIQIVGSRGDVQPFVALGKVLKDTYGHRVRVATHATFQQFVEENGLEFFCIGGDPAELMAFMVKHPGLMPGFDALTSGEVTKRRKGIADMLLGCWRSCIEAGNGLGPPPKPHGRDEPLDLHAGLPGDENEEPFVADAIIANPPSFAHVHVAEKLGIPLHMMFTMPWSPTRAFPHPLANVQSSNVDDVMTNYMTYTLVEMMTWQGLGDVINRFRDRVLDLPPLALLWAPGLVNRLKISYTYCWSPALIPKPKDWGNNIDISGFFFLDLASSYTPPPDLAAFLDAGEPPVYIGFGSIVVDDPNAMTRMIFDAIRASGVRALVSKGWGGLGADELGVPEGVFMLGNVPHDWLFQRVSCVVHHGGAGTTAAGIKAGKPTVVVPFFGDQPFWGAMIAKAKAGPDPVPYKSLTAEKLAESITFCLQQDTSARARDLGQRIREEKGTDVGGQSFHNHLNTDNLRCTLAPSKTAAWRVRRTQVKLSPLAAAVLVEDGLLKYSDMKLYRSTEYNTEHQPPDPISAAASSIIMDATSIGMSIADMPKDLFRSRQRARENRNAQTPSAEDSDSPPPTLQGGLSPMASTTDVASVSSDHKGSGNSAMISPPSESARPGTASSSQLTSPDAASLRSPKSSRSRDATAAGIGLEAAVGTGRNVGRIVSTGVKSPMNFCLGVAKGFRNIPLAYNDDTVRPVEKVTDLSSGIRVAGKEFGLGLYDGISGLVTQPLRGAAKDGAPGLVKGFGKGIGGLIVKPAAAVWSLPAYTMQGVHAEVSKMFAKSSQNYIIASRIAQGRNEILNATREEQQDIILRWRSLGSDLKDFNNLKKKEKTAGKSPASSSAMLSPEPGASRMEVPSWLRGQLSLDERRKIRAQKEAAKKAGVQHYPDVNTSSSTLSSEDAEFERAILASVRDTSRGNAEEDAMIEAAIRESVAAVRQSGGLPEPVRTDKSSQAWPEKSPAMFQDEEYQITDEEYQALVEQAIKQSMGVLPASDMDEFHETKGKYPDTVVRESSAGPSGNVRDEDDEDLQRALAASRIAPALPPRQVDNPTDDDELQRAIEASKQDLELEQAQKTEEDVVFEYMRKQSLAEEEWRRLAAKGKGPADEDDDEEFKRALEESLKMGHGNGQHGSGGPSSRA
ncbi:family 1 glycosyltransferase [Stachybotrys elegans]|uniref:Family 1 glycosyltransferase n=1 Tax=Stachybotrys elegans TaxID=80388 RepID=A0A8K0SWD3_9HYPO|nr:family 1 glycosyltransferase [Stachybotrys elegans]